MTASSPELEAAAAAFKEHDYASAVAQLRILAEQGDPKAQLMLAEIYFDGLGVPQDHHEAVKWTRKAAEQGFDSAQHSLGRMYSEGIALPRDRIHGYAWLTLAAHGGNSTARKDCDELAKNMSAAEITAAERLSSELIQKSGKT